MDRVEVPQAEAERVRKLRGLGRYTADERFAQDRHGPERFAPERHCQERPTQDRDLQARFTRGRFSGAAFAAFVRSPHAHARIVSVDASDAASMPGVVWVLTGRDCAALGNFPVIDRIGKGLLIPFRPVLACDIVRHPGEAVACVIAETQAQALDAAEAVLVDYDALPAAVGLLDDAPLVHPGTPSNVALRHEAGDAEAVETAMTQAALVVETEIELPRLAPVTLEPRAAAARWDAENGVYIVRAPHQGVNEMRRDFAAVFGLPADRFQVLTGEVGGGFGPRNIAYPEYAAVMLAARLTGRAVVWQGTRSESFLTDIQGRGVRMRGRLAVDAAGRFTALSMQYDADLGAYISPVAVFAAVNNPLQSLTGCYAIPAAHAVLRTMHTNAVPTGPYRGAGRPEMALLVERLTDIAARRLGIDPFVLRQRNIIPMEAFPWTLPNGARYDSGDFARLMRTAREASDWDGFAARQAAAPGVRLGRGMALFIEVSGGGGAPDEAALTLSAAAGRAVLRIETVTASTGQSHARTFALVAGPRLGLPEVAVTFVASAPGTALSGAGSYASRSTIAAGGAVAQAADALAARLLGMAALRANCAPEDLHLADEAVCRTDGTPVCRMVDLLAEPLTETGRVMPSQAFASGCHVAEVAVDEATGAAVLTRYLAVDDAGVTIDHQAAEAQIQGGIAQGVGEVLGEDAVIDAESGQPYAASLMDYMLPRANDFPSYRVLECNTPSPFNPLGVKGIGEAGTTGALCAVTSAVADALDGRDLPAMPFTQERLWRTMRG
jgi:aerobic carbon-monoxide dehydrogenase large subunit